MKQIAITLLVNSFVFLLAAVLCRYAFHAPLWAAFCTGYLAAIMPTKQRAS